MVASTRRRVFSARQFSPSHFFRVDEFPFAVTTSFSRERGLEKRVPERNDATVERASDAQKRVVRYRLVSIPAVLALFRRVRRSRTPSQARTHARAATIVVSMSRIVAQKRVLRKKKERERREDDANRATVSSLSRRERKQRTYAKRCHLVRVLLKMGVDVSVRVLRANRICRFYS